MRGKWNDKEACLLEVHMPNAVAFRGQFRLQRTIDLPSRLHKDKMLVQCICTWIVCLFSECDGPRVRMLPGQALMQTPCLGARRLRGRARCLRPRWRRPPVPIWTRRRSDCMFWVSLFSL